MSNFYTVKEFMALVDKELKQGENAHRTSINDSMRLAKESEIIAWLNQGLGELLEYNKAFYSRVISYFPSADATSFELPFFMRRLDKISVSGKWYSVASRLDEGAKIWFDGSRTIVGNGVSFSKNNEILLKGVVTPDVVIDEDSVLDFPPTFIRLLLLQVLVYFSGRDNRRKELWFGQYMMLLKTYKSTSIHAGVHGKTIPTFGFGG